MFANMNLTKKLVLLFLAFGLVPMSVVGWIAYNATSSIEGKITQRFEDVAVGIADKIDRNLSERYGDVQAFALNRAIFNRDQWFQIGERRSDIVAAMNQYVETNNIYFLTILVDLEGNVIAVNSKNAEGRAINTEAIYLKNYRNTPWFQAVSSGNFSTRMPYSAPGNDVLDGTFIEDLHIDEDVKASYSNDDGLTVGFSAPVYQDGKVIAYWSNRSRFSPVEDIFKAAYAELKNNGFPGSELTLLDKDGRVIVDYDPIRAGSEEIVHDFGVLMELNLAEKGVRAAQEVVGGKRGNGWAFHARKEIVQAAGYTHLRGALGYPGMNWSVLARVPQSEAGAEINAIRRNIYLSVGLCLGLILALGIFVGRNFAAPLIKMADAAKKIAVGDINQKIEHRSGDEIGSLAQAFRTLIEYIKGIAEGAEGLRKGDLSIEIVAQSDQDVLSRNFIEVIESLKGLVAETQVLIQASQEGALEVRGDRSKFEGAYAELVGGINEILETSLRPVNEAGEVLGRIADRDLTARMNGAYKGDHARIKEALNGAMGNLDQGLLQVAVNTEQVSSASGQISSGSQTLAQGASEQASSLEEISSSLQEVSSMARQNATNAQEAKGMVEGAQDSTNRGVESMNRLSEAIDRIKTSSDETAKIVNTINEIAFQTNLLALNAAVEAARAGDAGKGFAVVAEEVRNLAMRSAEAAKNTADLIEESVENAESGVSINQEMLQNLEEINAQVSKVGAVMEEIATGSNQQNEGIEQISTGVDQVNTVTQQSAANAEESASAAEELSSQSAEMQNLVRSFQLSENGSTVRPAVPRQKTPLPERAAHTPENAAVDHLQDVNLPREEGDLKTLQDF